MDYSAATFDVGFNHRWWVVIAVSLALLEDTVFPAHGATVLAVRHFDGFPALKVFAIDDIVLDRVEGQ